MTKITGVVVVRNRQSQRVSVAIEPWAEERLLLPGQEVRIRYSSTSIGELSFETSPGYISVYAWVEPQCILEFVDEG